MTNAFMDTLSANYQFLYSLYMLVGIVVVSVAGSLLLRAIPDFREARALNTADHKRKLARESYVANLSTSQKTGALFYALIFVLIMPFVVTPTMNVWWRLPVDVFAILMIYDFFYYLTHRFMFHDYKSWKGPLLWVHAVHHRQHRPCRADSNYIHPLEQLIGLALISAVMGGYAAAVGRLDLPTSIVAWVLYIQMNLHNHALWESKRFPFRSLHYLSDMHHNHHIRFDAGNFGSITMFYDWLFGTLDYGRDKKRKTAAPEKAHAGAGK